MGVISDVLVVVLILFANYITPSFQQLSSSQTEVLQQLCKQLEYPKELEAWRLTEDICSIPPSPSATVTCEESSITEIRIVGNKPVKATQFDGYSIPNQTLPSGFSSDSFFTTLTRLTSLRVLILVSLGMWGPLSDKIHRLYSLEVLDLSSNFLYGTIPPKISAMGVLQSLTLDGNFFNDTIPDWCNSLPNITVLSMKSNQLRGPLPMSIGGVKTLTTLSLSSNNISGKLPDLSGLSNLEVLDLRQNQLDSELPNMPNGVVTVLLSRNSISGEVPAQFGELNRLQHLDISYNLLHGTPPSTLFSLPNITYLSLESNILSGSLPIDLNCSNQLGFVDISANKLMGNLPSCLSGNSNKRVVKFSGNCLAVDTKHQHDASYCEVDVSSKSSKAKETGLLIGVVGGPILVLLCLVVLIFCRRNFQRATAEQRLLQKAAPDGSPSGFATELLENARLISQSKKLGAQVLPMYRVFSVEELRVATNNFNRSTYISEGLTGKTYKGKLENGDYVAIKSLSFFAKYPIRNLKLRLDLLSKLRHPNLVCLLGHCIDGAPDGSSVNRVFLVYEYIPNGNLRTHLSEILLERALRWPDRLTVLIGIAKAVHFLHTGVIPGFYNNRLKTNNVLLDEHLIAKVSDFGLSIITEEIGKNEVGPDMQKLSYSFKSKSSAWKTANLDDDVYTFGFILLETLIGPSTIERGEAFCLTELATLSRNQDDLKQMLDPTVLATSAPESLSIIVSLTNKCVAPDPSFRPSIEDVLWNLQYAAQLQATTDGDQRSDVTSQA